MPRQGQTTAQARREERQEDMRNRIRDSNLLTDIIDNIDKMQALADITEAPKESEDGTKERDPVSQVNALQMVNNQRFKLLAKVLPDLKFTEVSAGEGLKVLHFDYTGFDPEAPNRDIGGD
jgi:hypothetical protein